MLYRIAIQEADVQLDSCPRIRNSIREYFDQYAKISDGLAHPPCRWNITIDTIMDSSSNQNQDVYSKQAGNGSSMVERTISIDGDTHTVEQRDEAFCHVSVLYTVDVSKNRIKMYLPNTGQTVVMAVIRILRCVFIYELLSKGWSPFHAAAVKLKNRVICISGEKFSGKTTTMMAALRNWRASFISNDKVFVKNISGVTYVCALPISVGVRKNTSELFSLYTERFARAPSSDRESFSPQEIAAFFDVDVDCGGRLSSVIIPHYVPNFQECRFMKVMDGDKYESFFLRQYLTDIFKHHSFWEKLAHRNGLFVRENIVSVIPNVSLWLLQQSQLSVGSMKMLPENV